MTLKTICHSTEATGISSGSPSDLEAVGMGTTLYATPLLSASGQGSSVVLANRPITASSPIDTTPQRQISAGIVGKFYDGLNRCSSEPTETRTKVCTVCREPKLLPEFAIQKCNRDGRHSQCKRCRADKLRAIRKPAKRIGRGMNSYRIVGDFAVVEVRAGGTFKVSASDIPILEAFNRSWQVDTNGYISAGGRENYRSWRVSLHRFLMTPPDNLVVDHINGDRSDNRRENLRVVTHLQNVRFACERRTFKVPKEIRRSIMERAQVEKRCDLAVEFGCSPGYISQIALGRVAML